MNNLKRWAAGVVAAVCLSVVVVTAMQPRAQALDVADLLGFGGTASSTTCAIDNIGWLVCPILRSAAKAGDYAFTFISQNFLSVEMALFNSDSGTAQAWSSMRDIANVLFVCAFLVVIYSLITGRGVGNYNIKRMLPRFIIGAIMVNLSYYICQLLIDISNIMGSGVNTVFAGIARSIGPSGMPLATEMGSYDTTVLIDITASVLGKVGVAWILFAPLLAIVLSVAIISAVIILILIIRKTLVVALVLLSPLAFVTYLLPNTEHYFSKWLRLFLQTLLLFPVIAVLLGTGQIVSATIIKAGAGGGYQVEGDEYRPHGEFMQTSATLRLVAAGAAVLPLAGTWYAFKVALAGVDAAALRVRQGSRRSGSRREDSAKRREQAAMDLNKKSMMLNGINRLQQIGAAQDGETGIPLIGRIGGGAYRGRKKQQKSSEQKQFDQQVQDRLSELRTSAAVEGLSPQQVYSRALQRYQDAEAAPSPSNDQLSINSYEGINLKAAEAYLLENIGQSVTNGAVNATTDEREKKIADSSRSSIPEKDKIDEGRAQRDYDNKTNLSKDALNGATLGGSIEKKPKDNIASHYDKPNTLTAEELLSSDQLSMGKTGPLSGYDSKKNIPGEGGVATDTLDKGATSHFNKPSESNGSNSTNELSKSDASGSAALGGSGIQGDLLAAIQQNSTTERGSQESPSLEQKDTRTSFSGFAPQQKKLSELETKAKSRAARYLQQSQDEQGILTDTDPISNMFSSSAIVDQQNSTKDHDKDDIQDNKDNDTTGRIDVR